MEKIKEIAQRMLTVTDKNGLPNIPIAAFQAMAQELLILSEEKVDAGIKSGRIKK
jgi:hypothetical protein